MKRRFGLPLLVGAVLMLASPQALAQSTNTNGPTGYTPNTPNFVAIPNMPTMYVNGGAGKDGVATAKFLHDWGMEGMDAAKDCNVKAAAEAIKTLQSYLNDLSAAYEKVSAKGEDGSIILSDANVVASIINYIRQALAACRPPQGAMLVPSIPPDSAYAALPGDERHHDDSPFGNVSIGIGIGIGGGHGDRHHDDHPHD